MRDPGLEEAIRAAGGVSELARRIGISQPSVSNWARIPAERVLVGRGGDRRRPRASCGPISTPSTMAPQRRRRGRCRARAGICAARGAAGARARRRAARAARATCAAIATPLGVAHAALARSRQPRPTSSASSANISISSSGSAAASCCPTPRTISPASCTSGRWRGCATISRALGIERAEGKAEPEDHAAILCEIMAGLAGGRFPAPAGADQRDCSRSIWRPGSGASSPIWSGPRRPISTAASARSAACSWKSKRKRSRCRREAARSRTNPRRRRR